MHMARRRPAGRADPAHDLTLGDLLSDRHRDLGQVVVGGRKAVAGAVGVAQHDPVAVPAGPACVHNRPRQRRHRRRPTRLSEIDPVMPALSVGERVGPIAETGGRRVIAHRPPDQVTLGHQLRAVGNDAHRVGDQVTGLNQPSYQGRNAQWSYRSRRRIMGAGHGAGLGSYWYRQHDVGQGTADEGDTENQQHSAADPASVPAPVGFESATRPVSAKELREPPRAKQLHKAPLIAFPHDHPSRRWQKRAGAIVGYALLDSGYADC